MLHLFIADGFKFGVFDGTKEFIEYCIEQLNLMRALERIRIDKCSTGNRVKYMDLDIYKASRFFSCGKFDK